MTEPATQDVVVESEHPLNPKNLIVDVGLLVLEYYLVKWLLKVFGVWQKHNGPPVRRCSKQTPPSPDGWPTYLLKYSDFIAEMKAAQKQKKKNLTLHFKATNENAPNYETLKLWILTCVVNAQNGALDEMFIWQPNCPLVHHKWDTTDQNALLMICGCVDDSPNSQCLTSYNFCIGTGGESVFWYFWNDVNAGVLPKLDSQTKKGCPTKCKTSCGNSANC